MIVDKLKFLQYYSTKLPKFLQKIYYLLSKLSKRRNLESHFFELRYQILLENSESAKNPCGSRENLKIFCQGTY